MAELKDMLQYLRKRENLSQKDLAKKMNVSVSTIGMYETGKRMPALEIEESLANYFHVSLDELRGRSAPVDYSITAEEYGIVEAYRELPKAQKDMVKRMLAYDGLYNEARRNATHGTVTTGKKLISELTNYQGVKKKK